MTTATNFGADALKEILTTNLGVDNEAVDESLAVTLGDLGVDSIGVLELQTVVRDQYAVLLPETTGDLRLTEIIDYIDNSLKGAA
jgi:aromatase